MQNPHKNQICLYKSVKMILSFVTHLQNITRENRGKSFKIFIITIVIYCEDADDERHKDGKYCTRKLRDGIPYIENF